MKPHVDPETGLVECEACMRAFNEAVLIGDTHWPAWRFLRLHALNHARGNVGA